MSGRIRENGGWYSTGASDGHIWSLETGECSPLCPAASGHSGPLLIDYTLEQDQAFARRMLAQGLSLHAVELATGRSAAELGL